MNEKKEEVNPFKKFTFTKECDAYNERVAILEYEGGLSRAEAEILARLIHPKNNE